MIKVKNQYVLMFGIGSTKDFIHPQDLLAFVITEAAGGELPAFEIAFKTRDPTVRKKITQKEIFNISIGRDEKEVQPVAMMLYSTSVDTSGSEEWIVNLTGTLNVPQFITAAKARSIKGTALSAIKTVASTYFSIDDRSAPSIDSQTWLQYGIPDRLFLKEIWEHSNIPNSFLLTAIGLDSSFILRDIKSLASAKPRYNLTEDVVLNGGVKEVSNFGFINNWAGFGRERTVHTLEDSTDVVSRESISTHTVHSADLEQHPNPGINTLASGLQSDNVHTRYQAAKLKNVMGLTTFSGVTLFVAFSDLYLPIRPLDLVYYNEKTAKRDLTIEAVSGNYIVSRIGRSIENKKLVTVLELVRESRNTI